MKCVVRAFVCPSAEQFILVGLLLTLPRCTLRNGSPSVPPASVSAPGTSSSDEADATFLSTDMSSTNNAERPSRVDISMAHQRAELIPALHVCPACLPSLAHFSIKPSRLKHLYIFKAGSTSTEVCRTDMLRPRFSPHSVPIKLLG
jgi:hypothetical protein